MKSQLFKSGIDGVELLDTFVPTDWSTRVNDRVTSAMNMVAGALAGVEQSRVDAACRMIATANAVGVYGCDVKGTRCAALRCGCSTWD